jgi:hypothetical protein
MSLEYHKKYWNNMLPVLRKYAVGWNIGKLNGGTYEYSYGIHLTTHFKNWRQLALARFGKFFDHIPNKIFVQIIAQRDGNYSGLQFGSGINKVKDIFNLSDGKLAGTKNRYACINFKNKKLIELRIFASTLNDESFMKNLEFMDAMWRWCHETPYALHYIDFLEWLGSNPEHFKKYSSLISYLKRPRFYIKETMKPIRVIANRFPFFDVAKNKDAVPYIYNPDLMPYIDVYTDNDLLDKDMESCV